ncbi:MAG TPA: heavy metal translocating P-type ATPase, partial [Ruminococcaceae bacterium]|nr:heavy metal translocating P-type ATPase [Oscillospiraceae bacterium]
MGAYRIQRRGISMNRLKTDESFRTLCLTALSGVFLAADFFHWLPGLPFSPAWVAVLLCGAPIVFGAVRGLVTEFDVTADVLVAIALAAALLLGQYFAAGEVAFIMQLGKVLEDETAAKSHKSLRALIRLTPQTACVRTPAGEKTVAADDVKPGDILLVRPGQTVPADGKIRSGAALIDQSVMTGESIPVTKGVGDEVYQGTVNQQGAVEVEAVGAGDDSALKKMVRLVREAEEKKAPIVRLADRWARILVPVALGCAALILLTTRNMTRAVTALVVFCPCSLILAAPTAVMAAIGNATKRGVLIKSGEAVEAAASLDTLAMDKTGTLTVGKPQVSEIRFLDRDMDEKELLPLIAGAEKFSEHPLGRAVLEYCRKRGA